MVEITKNEMWYSLGGAALLLAWFLKGRYLVSPFLESIPPIFAFILYNSVFLVGMYFLVGLLTGKKNHWKWSFITVAVFIGIDIITAPYLVTASGINTGVDYWYVSSDAAIASLYNYFATGNMLVFLTYILTPLLLVFVLPIILLQPTALKKLLAK